MALLFNINNNFKNRSIVLVNSNVEITKKIIRENFIFLVDNQNNVHSINLLNSEYFNATLNKTDFYSMTHLTNRDEEKLNQLIQKNNFIYKKEAKTYFTIGKIIKRYQHPKSDKLFLLDIDVKEEKYITIVTNTLNSLENELVVIARLGAMMSNGLEIKPNKIMDFESKAMLCSYKSLNIIQEKEGIILLDKNEYKNKIGQEFEF